MKHPHSIVTNPPRNKTTDKAFVLSVLRSISYDLQRIKEVVNTAGIALDRGLISPAGAINMANGVVPGAFEAFLLEVETAEIGIGYAQEAAE